VKSEVHSCCSCSGYVGPPCAVAGGLEEAFLAVVGGSTAQQADEVRRAEIDADVVRRR
jgi:hypothetical protein